MPTISIGKYLIHRLKEVGVETIFGVPGDYNMVLSKLKRLEVLGCICRHINRAYHLLATT
jgi:TPP-dependent 2-oxoacid decarboxylase